MEIDSNGLEVLTRGEAMRLLKTQEVGRLVYTRAGLPAVTPVNYAVREGALWIFTGSLWSIAQASRGVVVAFEVDHLDRVLRAGWSVCVLGRAVLVTDPNTVADARGDGPAPWVGGQKDALVRITPATVTGRWIGPHDRHQLNPAPSPAQLYAAAVT